MCIYITCIYTYVYHRDPYAIYIYICMHIYIYVTRALSLYIYNMFMNNNVLYTHVFLPLDTLFPTYHESGQGGSPIRSPPAPSCQLA